MDGSPLHIYLYCILSEPINDIGGGSVSRSSGVMISFCSSGKLTSGRSHREDE
jgi:hypothetical protein